MPAFSCFLCGALAAFGLHVEPAGLIKNLASSSYMVRHQASTELIAMGPRALPALHKALPGRDLETKRRIEACIQAIENDAPYVELSLAYDRQMVLREMLICCKGRCIYPDMERMAAAHATAVAGLEKSLQSRGVGELQLQAMRDAIAERHKQSKERVKNVR